MGNSTTSKQPHRLGSLARAVVASAAVAGLAVTAGTGFMLQSTIDDQTRRVAETAALRAASEPDPAQLGANRDILVARAVGAADEAVAGAEPVVASAAGKVDAAALTATLAQLEASELMDPARVFELIAAARTQADDLAAAIAEWDRVEAERKAAEEAARIEAERIEAERAARQAAGQSAAGGGAGTGGGGGPAAPANPSGAQQIAREMIAGRYGWGDDQFGCLVAVWNYESGWNVSASNPNGAYGIPQALPGSKMASHGADWQSNPATQISWGIDYIAGRYGNPCGAWGHIQSTGWY
ncbi:lytic transglycosylase domain-containing protein [Agromyces larvae]|uniref:Lytic transglycosylase domain-containing protein n=1 Tax=Agromyces larvae TaxID=2929802 RepID=A0ABY4C201_9MICO|nr:lytic transglycosylase domain-containing protein [Agromyces larvae]UOE42805.1 lytic transglycosylase domain-containing protein [Agromyces larvae]